MLFSSVEAARGSCIGLLGGGGKTALMHQLGKELAGRHRTLLTSLTKAAAYAPHEVTYLPSLQGNGLATLFRQRNPVYLMRESINQHKLKGLEADDLMQLKGDCETSIFECDGARNLSLKVHSEYDPAIPAFCTHLIIVVGADVVGTRLSDGTIHRPQQFAVHWNIAPDEELTPEFISRVVSSKRGYLGKAPDGLIPTYYVNKVDSHEPQAMALAEAISAEAGRACAMGSLYTGNWEWVSNF